MARVKTSRKAVWAGILVAATAWGTGPVAVRAAFDQGLGVLELSGMRSVVAFLSIAVVLAMTHKTIPRARRVWKIGIVVGLAGMSGVILLTSAALVYASAGFAGIMLALTPLVTAVVAHATGTGERLRTAKLAGLLVALVGVSVLLGSGEDGLRGGGTPLLAAALMLGAVALASVPMVYAKATGTGLDPIDLAWAQFSVAAVFLTVLMLAVVGLPSDVTPFGWILVVYLGAIPTALSFTVTYWLLQRTTVTHTMLVTYIHPIVAASLGGLLLGENVGAGLAVGGALILLGLVVTDYAQYGGDRTPAVSEG